MKFLVGVLGAIIFAVLAWVTIIVLDIDRGWLTYTVAGVITFIGFSIAQVIYDKAKSKK